MNVDLIALRQAIRLSPDSAEAHYRLGKALEALGKRREALAAYTLAVELCPKHLRVRLSLGRLLFEMQHFDLAENHLISAVEIDPNSSKAHLRLAKTLAQIGLVDKAHVHFRQAAKLAPERPDIHATLIGHLHFVPGIDCAAVRSEQACWTERHAKRIPTAFPNPRWGDISRRLRIGYLSRYFKEHAEAYFTLPLIENHRRELFDVYCYAAVQRPDDISARFQRASTEWRDVHAMDSLSLANRIRADGIDILIDCSQHYFPIGLVANAQRSAPVQVSWLPFVEHAGFNFFDYRISDPIADPANNGMPSGVDSVYRLPYSSVCFAPIGYPNIESLPLAKTGRITFGSLNQYPKVNDSVLRCWAALLERVPDSHLILRCPSGAARQRTLEGFAKSGIDPERISFVGQLSRAAFLRNYHNIDIALDTFPYNGCATTCDALWMGVPVVTMPGTTAVSRAGLSLLTSGGLAEYIAHNEDEYVNIAARLACDPARLIELRATMRDRLRTSSLMDSQRYTADVEYALRAMWDRYRARLQHSTG